MGFVNGVRRLFGSRKRDQVREKRTTEQGVALDGEVASSRATGGEHAELSGDRGSVTGTGHTQGFVGRTAGDDVGYAGETGAERRAHAPGLDLAAERGAVNGSDPGRRRIL